MLETPSPQQKILDRFWIEISVVIIILALINGMSLGLFYTTQQKTLKAACFFFEAHIRSILIISSLQDKKWPTLLELRDKLPEGFTVAPSYEGFLTHIYKHSLLIPTYTDFACTKKTHYFPETDSYVRCIGRAYQIQ